VPPETLDLSTLVCDASARRRDQSPKETEERSADRRRLEENRPAATRDRAA
jgi:hypothetical protein